MLAACAGNGVRAVGTPPAAARQIWDVAAARFVEPAVLVERSRAADIVLLGETHDNPDHHQVQRWLLDAVATTPTNASNTSNGATLVMEQYDLEQQDELDAIRHTALPADTQLDRLGKLMGPGWEWPLYKPLVASALADRLPIVAANISRQSLRQVARGGFDALGSGEEKRLGLASDWSASRQRQLEQEVQEGHCGQLPPVAVTAVARSQRARDAIMADKLLAASGKPAMATFGRGHVRKDLAVPFYLASRAPAAQVVSIGMLEADAGTTAASDPSALATGPLGQLYDYLVLTPERTRAEDPCAALQVPGVKAP